VRELAPASFGRTFVGRRGAHPSQVATIGWNDHDRAEHQTIDQPLAVVTSVLESGRVPVLVCDECGDLACGALAVRIKRHGDVVRWTDWAYEHGYEPAKPLECPTYPEMLEFDLIEYQRLLVGVAERRL
jgi:hypothetical protein